MPLVVPPAEAASPTETALLESSEPRLGQKSEERRAHEGRLQPEKVEVWGTNFAKLTMSQAVDLADQIVRLRKPEYFVTANLNYLMLSEDYPRLAEVNQSAAAILADGHPIVFRSRLGLNPLPCRVAGADLIVELARRAATCGHRIFFLGGAPGVAQNAATELKRRFPQLQVAGCLAPPFRSLTSAEHAEMLGCIRQANADILLVAFGQPKGELWIYDYFQELGVPLSIQLGASFDFLAGTARRSPRVWQRLGCEWLYRAFSDPVRLVPRYSRNALYLLRQISAELVNRKHTLKR